MGIRLALGAAGSDVVRLVLRQGARLSAIGVLLGTLAAIAVSGAMDQLLWNVEPTDPLTIAAVAPRCLRSRRSDREPPELWSVDEAGAHAV
jgi:ABC-type lipoprotein release transport system permease subunit